jgi:SAM-dependent methyltransferase
MAVALAENGPPGMAVVGLDGEPAVAAVAAARARRLGGAARRVRFGTVRMEDGPAALREAAGGAPDLVWVCAAVHHVPDQQRAVDDLAAALAPGGRLALAEGGLPAHCLPWDVGVGAPGLEGRLVAAQQDWFGRMRAALPGTVPMPYGWPEALRHAGLTDVATRTFLVERAVTPDSPAMAALLESLEHRVERLTSDVSLTGEDPLAADDLAAWQRLLDPDDPAWLGHRGDLHHLEARSVHVGRRPA